MLAPLCKDCCRRFHGVAPWHAGPDQAISNDPGVQPTTAQLPSRPVQGPDVRLEAALTPQCVKTALPINGSVRGLVSNPGCIGGTGGAGQNSSASSRLAAHTVQGVRHDHAAGNVCDSVGCTASAMPIFAVSCMSELLTSLNTTAATLLQRLDQCSRRTANEFTS